MRVTNGLQLNKAICAYFFKKKEKKTKEEKRRVEKRMGVLKLVVVALLIIGVINEVKGNVRWNNKEGEREGKIIKVGEGKVVYVATNGNDESGQGTLSSPFLSLSRASQVVSPGDSIQVFNKKIVKRKTTILLKIEKKRKQYKNNTRKKRK